jgi:hypothetical protein
MFFLVQKSIEKSNSWVPIRLPFFRKAKKEPSKCKNLDKIGQNWTVNQDSMSSKGSTIAEEMEGTNFKILSLSDKIPLLGDTFILLRDFIF